MENEEEITKRIWSDIFTWLLKNLLMLLFYIIDICVMESVGIVISESLTFYHGFWLTLKNYWIVQFLFWSYKENNR